MKSHSSQQMLKWNTMIASIMTKNKEPMVSGRIDVFADDWTFYPDSLDSQSALEGDINFLHKSNPATGSVFLKKLPNYNSCRDHLKSKDLRKFARCIVTMGKV